MPTGLLNIDDVELVSTLRAAPQKGAPSSQDYNDSQRESLQDLAALTQVLNSYVIPLLNTLAAVDGTGSRAINGDTVFATAHATDALFLNSIDGEPLTVSSVLARLSSICQNQQTALSTLTARVSALTTQLSASNQNDIAKAIQGYSAQLQQFYLQIALLQNQIQQFVSGSTPFSGLTFAIGSATPTPLANTARLYLNVDGKLHVVNSTGTDIAVGTGTGSTGTGGTSGGGGTTTGNDASTPMDNLSGPMDLLGGTWDVPTAGVAADPNSFDYITGSVDSIGGNWDVPTAG